MAGPKTGTIQFAVPSAGKDCFTAYKIYGELSSLSVPLICLHGGPGVPHHYIEPIGALNSTTSIPVVFYDQLGCGDSTRLPEKKGDGKFWTVELFIDELENLISALGIEEYDLLGQSWGGMLAAAYATSRPKQLRKLIIADSPASMKDWLATANRLREALPKDVQATLLRHEADGTFESPEYEEAMKVFYDRHVCRVKPLPEVWLKSENALKEDNTVYLTMNGPSEFHVNGTLKGFNIKKDLHKINVPTLLINGKYDEAQDEVMEPFFNEIAKVKWRTFGESSHTPQLEEPEAFLKVVTDFLLQG